MEPYKVVELQDTLPNKPSELIRVALKDLEEAERDPHYEVEMCTWHRPSSTTGVCTVCLAGSVLAKSCGVVPEYILPTPVSLLRDPKVVYSEIAEWNGTKSSFHSDRPAIVYTASQSLVHKLNILDDLRTGETASAYRLIEPDQYTSRQDETNRVAFHNRVMAWCDKYDRDVVQYEDDPEGFKDDLRALADAFAKDGY
jgi:hypothetical protein